jgi:hypothetical protein
LAIQNELLHNENQGLIEALQAKKKQNKKSKALDLNKHKLDYWGGTQWHSPRQFGEARRRERIMKEIAHADELKEAERNNLKHANKLYNDKIAEEKKAQRARD